VCETNIPNYKGSVNDFFVLFEQKNGVWRPGSGVLEVV